MLFNFFRRKKKAVEPQTPQPPKQSLYRRMGGYSKPSSEEDDMPTNWPNQNNFANPLFPSAYDAEPMAPNSQDEPPQFGGFGGGDFGGGGAGGSWNNDTPSPSYDPGPSDSGQSYDSGSSYDSGGNYDPSPSSND